MTSDLFAESDEGDAQFLSGNPAGEARPFRPEDVIEKDLHPPDLESGGEVREVCFESGPPLRKGIGPAGDLQGLIGEQLVSSRGSESTRGGPQEGRRELLLIRSVQFGHGGSLSHTRRRRGK